MPKKSLVSILKRTTKKTKSGKRLTPTAARFAALTKDERKEWAEAKAVIKAGIVPKKTNKEIWQTVCTHYKITDVGIKGFTATLRREGVWPPAVPKPKRTVKPNATKVQHKTTVTTGVIAPRTKSNKPAESEQIKPNSVILSDSAETRASENTEVQIDAEKITMPEATSGAGQ
jgi:hypothetical protein